MRFRLRTDVWMNAKTLGDAQDASSRLGAAAVEALGDAASKDPESGAMAKSELDPVDEEAHEALRAEDLGPGISGWLWRAEIEPGHPPDD